MSAYTKINRALLRIIAAIVVACLTSNAHAGTFTVTSLADSGPGSLRQALADANALSSPDTINFHPALTGAIVLSGGALEVDSDVTISGPGPGILSLSGGQTYRVFQISGGHVVAIEGLSIVNGSGFSAWSVSNGGGILNDGSTLTVSNCVLSGNASGDGGAIYTTGSLTLVACTLNGNQAYNGGGIFTTGPLLKIFNCTISNNTAEASGGAICNSVSSFNVIGSFVDISASTISGNSAPNGGGILSSSSSFDPSLTKVTLSACTVITASGACILNQNATVVIGDTILSSASPATNISSSGGTVTSRGFNLYNDAGSGTYLSETSDRFATDLLVGPLANNGGPTLTHALLPGSPAIDQGNRTAVQSLATDSDQRGFARVSDDAAVDNAPGGDGSDIGSFELQAGIEGNIAPTVVNDAYNVVVDVELAVEAPGVLANDTDPNSGDVLTAVLVDPPAHSFEFALNPDGSFEYLAADGFVGLDGFTYRANDGKADSSIGTVTINVRDPSTNQAPVANDDGYILEEPELGGYLPPPGILENDSDPDGDPLTAVLVTPPAHAFFFELNPDGSFTYNANFGYNGTDTFTYIANDGLVDSNVATVTIQVGPVTPPNRAPVANDDGYLIEEPELGGFLPAPGVLANDTDPDGNALNAVLVTPPAHAFFFELNPDGSFTYNANFGYIGTDTFTYRASDGLLDSNVATVTIQVGPVTPPNRVPVANSDGYQTEYNQPLSVSSPGVLGNDTDADGDSLVSILVNQPTHAQTFSLNLDGSFTYVPAPGFSGQDSFTYFATDGQLDSIPATVTIVVNQTPPPPPSEADLLVGLGVDNLNPRQGDLLTYTITVRNYGPDTAVNTVVRDALSSGTTFYSAKANRGRFTSPVVGQTGTIAWYVGDVLDAGQESAEIQVTVVVKGKTTITNTASVTSDTSDPDPANNSATLLTSVAQGGSGGNGGGKRK